MTLTITLRTDNAAFDGDAFGPEVARILRRLADNIERDAPGATDDLSYALRDGNGNKVGDAEFSSVEGR